MHPSRTSLGLPILAVLLAAGHAAGTSDWAEPEPIWRIGAQDHHFRDLAHLRDLSLYLNAFPDDTHFVVGKSKPHQDFCSIHPGPDDAWAGSRDHAFRISFGLEAVPAGAYELRVSLVDSNESRPTTLRVNVNDEDQSQEVVVATGAGEIALRHPEKGESRTLHVVLGADWLKQGSNWIELLNVDGSWLLYDSLSLRELAANARWPVQISARPSIFFVELEGRVKQEFTISLSGLTNQEPVTIEAVSGENPLGAATFERSSVGTASGALYVEPAETPRDVRISVSAGTQTGDVTMRQIPQRKWRVYVTPGVHTDIGYTASHAWVTKVHNRNTDLALELIKEFPLYHFNLEASWAAQTWLRNRPPYRHEELYEAAREGRIGIEAGYLNMLTGLCSEEEMVRTLYYSARLRREHGVPFQSYTLTDVPSAVWSLPSILAGSGIRSLSCGINWIRSRTLNYSPMAKTPFWWEGPDGGRVLTWFSDGYAWGERFALREGGDRIRTVLRNDLSWWDRREDYPYDAILLHGGYSDNAPIGRRMAESVTEYSERYAYPKVILCDNNRFFEYIEANFADKIPTVRGCGGSWWEDGAGSTAVETAINRNAHQDIIAAEMVWAAAVGVAEAPQYPRSQFDLAWDNILLYDEHTWGTSNSIEDPMSDDVQREWALKAAHARDAAAQTKRLLEDGLRELANEVRAPDNSVLVFNPSGRARSGVVYVDVPVGAVILDEQRPVIQQVVSHDLWGNCTLALVASGVPAVGYRTYQVVSDSGVMPSPSGRFDGKTLENEFYRITFDPATGGMASLIDKTLGRELVDQASPFKLGQLVYASGGEEKKGETQMDCPIPERVTFSSPAGGDLGEAVHGPVFSSVTWDEAKHERFHYFAMKTILYEHERRVDFVFRMNKKPTYEKEAVYIAFPFAGADPEFRYEIGGGSVRPNEEHLPGACRDWLAVQRWVTVNTDGAGVVWSPIDTPLMTLCDFTPGKWLRELPITNGTIFAYAMNNYWYTNYKAGQDGWFTFRYSLTSDTSIGPSAASRFGESVVQPMRAIFLESGRKATGLLPSSKSFCEVDPLNVTLTALKRAEDGKALIVRVRETAGRNTDTRISANLARITKVSRCDLVERVTDPLDLVNEQVLLNISANSMATIRLE
jgi:alpha-mannosidase